MKPLYESKKVHTMLSKKQIKSGDMIQFESPTRFGHKILWRMVTGWKKGSPTVRFYGQNKFVVEQKKILAIQS